MCSIFDIIHTVYTCIYIRTFVCINSIFDVIYTVYTYMYIHTYIIVIILPRCTAADIKCSGILLALYQLQHT